MAGQRNWSRYYRRAADVLVDAQTRAEILRLRAEGRSYASIAKTVKLSASTIQRTVREAIHKVNEQEDEIEQQSLLPVLYEGPRQNRSRGPRSGSPPPYTQVLTGEVLPGEEEQFLRRRAFELRKLHWTNYDIAAELGITPTQAAKYARAELQDIQAAELGDASLVRLLQVEQLDMMARAVSERATGVRSDGSRTEDIDLKAQENMLKILKQKADLLGLNAPQRVDIEQRIEIIAKEGGYDIQELREIARDVMESAGYNKTLNG
jgi:hypothetical protein